MACIEAVHAISHPQLSVSLSLTLNHCTVLCEKGEKQKTPTVPPVQLFSLFHFLQLIGTRVGVRHSAVT